MVDACLSDAAAGHSSQNQSMFCEFNDGIPKPVAPFPSSGLLADPGEKKVFLTDSPSMTTLLSLINFCLRGFSAPLLDIYEAFQPAALVLCAQAAINKIAILVWSILAPARPIHAPTLLSNA